jgi:hypothetical protein
MAKMLSQLGTAIRGSVGGDTFTANQFHPIIIRARVSPVQPNTNYQTRVRAALSTASSLWPQQIEAVREGWDAYAATCTYQGPTGTYTIPGRQMFISNVGWMKYLQSLGVTFTTSEVTQPINLGFLGIGAVTITPPAAGTTGFKVNIVNPNYEDVKAVMYRSIAYPVSRTRFKGPWVSSSRQTVLIEAAGNANITFGSLQAGYRYFVNLRLIVDDGPKRLSQMAFFNSLAFVGAD